MDEEKCTTRLTETPTKYIVSLLPIEHPEVLLFGIEVEWRGVPYQVPVAERAGWDRTWAVIRHSRVLAIDGTWSVEPQPSSRTLGWCLAHRFTLDDALRLARGEAHLVVVNGIHVLSAAAADAR